MSYPNPIFSTFAFIGFLLVSIPLPWHLEAWNTGTCLYMIWTGLSCLNQFINSVVWSGNAINWAPVWCDISTRFMVGSTVAIPAASLCINRRLYHIACVKSVTRTRAEKHRAIMIDLAIGLGLPLLEMVLQYIVQGHRFNIFEDVGCVPFTYNTLPAYFLVSAPPIAIGLVSAVYSALSIFVFKKRQSEFKQLLSSNSNLNANRYFRLMCLAGIEILCTVPLGVYSIYLDATSGPMSPWVSFAVTHAGFSRVDQFPSIIWRNLPVVASSIELSRWLVVACAFIFFGFFGFADEAQRHYKLAFQFVAKRVGYSTASMKSGLTSSSGARSNGFSNMSSTPRGVTPLPIYVQREIVRKRDSFDSISDMTSVDTGTLRELHEKSSFNSLGRLSMTGTFNDYQEKPHPIASRDTTSESNSSVSKTLSPNNQSSSPPRDITTTRPEPALDKSSWTFHSTQTTLPRDSAHNLTTSPQD